MCVGRVRPGLAIALGIAATVIVLLAERGLSRIPQSAPAAHQYADSVLMPKFVALFNQWWIEHPTDAEGREGEHFRKVDAGDVKRWREVREAFRDLSRAFKRAGY